jgi:preprotein translocase subunit SecF
MITAIAMAAYTFAALTTAIINVIKYRKYNSPVFSASKAISLAAALVSMLTLESTMLTTFGEGTMTVAAQKLMIGATGGVISVLIVATAIYMIVVGTKKLKELKSEVENG